MKSLLRLSAFTLLLTAASCSGEDQLMERPRRYSSASESTKHKNDKSSFKKNRNPIGLGLDMNERNPYKFRMVKAPKKYKYSKAK